MKYLRTYNESIDENSENSENTETVRDLMTPKSKDEIKNNLRDKPFSYIIHNFHRYHLELEDFYTEADIRKFLKISDDIDYDDVLNLDIQKYLASVTPKEYEKVTSNSHSNSTSTFYKITIPKDKKEADLLKMTLQLNFEFNPRSVTDEKNIVYFEVLSNGYIRVDSVQSSEWVEKVLKNYMNE